jgi:phosphinothricin tripeptide acetyl hydrolase
MQPAFLSGPSTVVAALTRAAVNWEIPTMTVNLDKLRDALRANAADPGLPPAELRARMDANSANMYVAPEVTVEPATVGGIGVERLTPPGDTGGRTVLYLHGGGYSMGSLLSVRGLGAGIALASNALVVDLDYRLAPEHPCPAGIEDALTAYDGLLADGVDPARLAIGGDSAGGGLTVATLVAIRDSGRLSPAAGFCISPWLDLELKGASVDGNAHLDPMVTRALLERMAGWYAADLPRDDPRLSPVLADLTGLPPLLLQVGTAEALLDDVLRFEVAARAAGVEVTCEQWPDMIHVWHMFAPRLPAATEALDAMGSWLAKRWA